MRILVTGGCGFIGSNYLYHVFGTTNEDVVVNVDKLTYAGNPANIASLAEQYEGSRYFFEHADIADPEAMQRILETYDIEAVVNFAAESHVDRSIDDPAPFVTTNVQGTQVLLEASRRHGLKRFVHVSTDEVYGSLGPEGKFTEETPLAPNSPYSASKAAADLLVRAYVMTYDFPGIVTRCSNNYGPYQFPEKLIPLMYLKARAGEQLPVYGDGGNIRDWIHVADHCRGVDTALRHGRPGAIYNFGGDAEVSNLELVKLLLRQLDRPESLIRFVTDRPGHDRRYAMDYTWTHKELGWQPQINLEHGLKATIDWYGQHDHWLSEVQSGAYRQFMDRWYERR